MNLTDEQRIAATSEARDLLVIACPGSGKSTTLAARVKNFIRMGVPHESIVVITFTGAGGEAIKAKVGPDAEKLGHIGTLHGFMLKVISAYHAVKGLGSPAILPPQQIEEQLDRAAKEVKFKGSKKELLEELRTPRVPGAKRTGRMTPAEMVVARYQQTMLASGTYDFDMMLSFGLTYLKALTPADYVAAGMGRPFALFVDEYQDSGLLDAAIYEAMPVEWRTYVGDPDQSIYGFRGGRVENIIELSKAPGITVLNLSTNFRSTPWVCSVADQLIRNNLNRVCPLPMKSAREDGFVPDRPGVNDVNTQQEAKEVVTAMVLHGVRKFGENQVAVLCRTNKQVSAYETALAIAGVPIRRALNTDATGPDWREIMTYLALAAAPSNNLLAAIWLRSQAHRVRVKGSIEEAISNADVQGTDLNSQFQIVPIGSHLRPVSELVATHTPVGLESSQIAVLSGALTASELAMKPGQLVAALKNRQPAATVDEKPFVTVCTIHAAKGREWACVVLPEWNEGVLPFSTAKDIEEERRLAYVALTRAADKIGIVTTRQMNEPWPPYRAITTSPSRFLHEINANIISA